jgi:hypothetical protein
MRPIQILAVAASLSMSLHAADALAVTCFEIIDKDQNVTYRSTQPPFDMAGDEWTRQQNLLRTKSLHLRWQTQNDCTPRITPSGSAPGELQKVEGGFDPGVILRSTPEYMTASGRPTPMMGR